MNSTKSLAAKRETLPRSIRAALRACLEFPRAGLLRSWLFRIEEARERKRLRIVASETGLTTLTASVVDQIRRRKPDADTAYILGTGASVAKLTQQQLDHISTQFSIGVNQWMLHSMVPDVYAYEVDYDSRLLESLDRKDVRLNKPLILFFRPKNRQEQENVAHIPEFLRSETFLYGRTNIWTRKRHNIGPDVSAIFNRLKRKQIFDVLLDNGASIVRMVLLSALLGFKRIVLVGVDLNNVRYFWHDDPSHLRRLGISDFHSGQRGKVHETLSASTRPFPVNTFVTGLAEALLDVRVVLEVDSPSSLLADTIPVSVWERFD